MQRTKFNTKKPFIITDVQGVPIIQNPTPGSIVEHSGWHPRPKLLVGYPCDVYIVEGQYKMNGRISNFWTWRKITKSKSGEVHLGPEVQGYGSFRETKK